MRDWKALLQEMDNEERNNNRRHKAHRDDVDTTLADRQTAEAESISGAKMRKLSQSEDWADLIFSRRAEDLHELVTDEVVSGAIRNLTLPQKEILFLNVIHRFKTSEIAAMRGVSERNIRKIRQRALESIRKFLETVSSRKAEGYANTAALVLISVICWPLWPFLIGWLAANWIYPRLKARIRTGIQEKRRAA